jgi:hypothetical protein
MVSKTPGTLLEVDILDTNKLSAEILIGPSAIRLLVQSILTVVAALIEPLKQEAPAVAAL